MQILETRSEVKFKVTVIQLWYATLHHSKMHPHTKFKIPTSKNIGDMHRTQSGTDGQCDYYMSPKVPLGAKKNRKMFIVAVLVSLNGSVNGLQWIFNLTIISSFAIKLFVWKCLFF